MEGTSRGDIPRGEDDTPRQVEPLVPLMRSELQRLMEEASRNALVQHERRTSTPIVREITRRQLSKEKENEKEQQEEASREEPGKGQEAEFSEVGSSERRKIRRESPGFQEQKLMT
ncbi:UNVERIFIED_CONTAM: hypothetical protein Slati_2257400 [Sesamum latifolium]|uniref:Uncharacterized protein n=1 Tax=Sesamum latifolium TaxID=2727402 RepID=A0AAW2WTZ9_9LAMI